MMPAPDAWYDQIKEQIVKTTDREKQNDFLDAWNAASTMVTEWDGEQWGFDTATWMLHERDRMAVLAHQSDKNQKFQHNVGPE